MAFIGVQVNEASCPNRALFFWHDVCLHDASDMKKDGDQGKNKRVQQRISRADCDKPENCLQKISFVQLSETGYDETEKSRKKRFHCIDEKPDSLKLFDNRQNTFPEDEMTYCRNRRK